MSNKVLITGGAGFIVNLYRGIVYNDATLAIDWHLSSNAMIISKKDLELPTFAAIKPE